MNDVRWSNDGGTITHHKKPNGIWYYTSAVFCPAHTIEYVIFIPNHLLFVPSSRSFEQCRRTPTTYTIPFRVNVVFLLFRFRICVSARTEYFHAVTQFGFIDSHIIAASQWHTHICTTEMDMPECVCVCACVERNKNEWKKAKTETIEKKWVKRRG